MTTEEAIEELKRPIPWREARNIAIAVLCQQEAVQELVEAATQARDENGPDTWATAMDDDARWQCESCKRRGYSAAEIKHTSGCVWVALSEALAKFDAAKGGTPGE